MAGRLKKGALPFLLAMFFLINGCTVRLIYNHLDWIIPWYVSDYIDLSDDQDDLFEKRLFAQLKWHRVTQLRTYSAFLRQLKHNLRNGLTYEDLSRCHVQMRMFWQDLVKHVAPDMAEILSSASDEQIEAFLEKLEKRNEKYKKRYMDPSEEERRQKKVARMNRFLDFCMGDVTEEQEKIVDRWSRQLKNISPVRFAFIRKSHARFREILKSRNDVDMFTNNLEEFLCFRRKEWPPELQEIAAHNRDVTKKTFLELVSCMTPDQRACLDEQIDDLANVFDELAVQRTND